jgi:tetratricopeptide (TPR) repeat protein
MTPTSTASDEDALNVLGYYYLEQKRTAEAIPVFTLNTEWFANSWNAYDSVREAQAAAGDRESAIRGYRKALQVNPKATSSEEALTRLEGK